MTNSFFGRITILSVAWAHVTSLDRTVTILLCALFLEGATTNWQCRHRSGSMLSQARLGGARFRRLRLLVPTRSSKAVA